jgi:hypothetical protein
LAQTSQHYEKKLMILWCGNSKDKDLWLLHFAFGHIILSVVVALGNDWI